MEKQRQTAGETAAYQPQAYAPGYPKRVRIFSPDGHARKDIVCMADDHSVERFLRNHARRIGWRISVRMAGKGGEA